MQAHMAGKDLRSFRDSAEEPFGILDGGIEAEGKPREKLAANQEECSNKGVRPPSVLGCCLVFVFVSIKLLWHSAKGKGIF